MSGRCAEYKTIMGIGARFPVPGLRPDAKLASDLCVAALKRFYV